MINTEVKALLEQYFEGTSTLEQESALKSYFNGSYDEAFKEYADLFTFIGRESVLTSSVELPQDLELMVISRLLEKYWDCETSLEDEQYLKKYFNGGQVHADLETFQSLFAVLNSESKIVTGDLNGDLETSPAPSSRSKVFSLSKKWMAVAASLLIGMMFWINVDSLDNSQANEQILLADLSIEEREAYEVTVEALAFLSGKLDKSSSAIGNDFKKVANADIFK